MKIKSIKRLDISDTPVYDVIDAEPCHNFLIKCKTEDRYVVSHNSKGADPQMEKSKIMKTYNSVLERMGSRFMVDGKIAGCLFLVSSKKTEYDFMESYIQRKKGQPGTLVIDAKLWEVKPSGTYSGKTFRVAVGGSNMPSKIIPEEEDSETYLKQGYTIIEPPEEFRGRFVMDIEAALMNIAGISVSMVTKFIAYTSLEKCYIESKNPFAASVLTIGLHDDLSIRDFFFPELVPSQIYTKPIFLHIDTSLTGDRTGIGAVARMGFKYENRYNIEKGEYVSTKELVYRHVFSVGIKCPFGSEISFQKTRDFVYYLKNELGWNIKGVSLDGFQSADSKQQFILMGFDNTKIVSLDRTPDGYLALKSSVNECRISLLKIPELEEELIHLERDNMTGKIDHPVYGSKDIADGLGGAVYNASLQPDDYSLYASEDSETILDANINQGVQDDRESILKNLVRRKSTYEELRMENNSLEEPEPEDAVAEKINRDIKEEVQKLLSASQVSDVVVVKKPEEPKKLSEQELRRKFEEAKRRRDGFAEATSFAQEYEDASNGFIL